ncbi:MAG: DtxR family transcriptional regulator, Mn-dependent transcriptional regulator [Pseudonocardiales bacterium]|nr:DtxR family transcriptional regulator, Mn-dependent transcriptional regulator [Pseudonocardiales bacterium]
MDADYRMRQHATKTPPAREVLWERGRQVNHHHSDLIDTTEMYLRTIYELEEEGVTPLRARIAERLSQSGPTVSQTVARMERDGLLQVESDRHLLLTERGRRLAVSVMRKHRIAERLLHDVIGLEWDQLHVEACRWEHVMSDAVERRIVAMLDGPLICPHGNPIPGLEGLGLSANGPSDAAVLPTLAASVTDDEVTVRIERISELLQPNVELMRQLSDSGMTPGLSVAVTRVPAGLHVAGAPDTELVLDEVARHIFVSVPA